MPLTARLRDEENERINNILKKLIALDYVPELSEAAVDEIMKDIGLSFEILSDLSPDDLILHLKRFHFDWENAELFGDFLDRISLEKNNNFKEKAVAVYKYIQSESKTFSFPIAAKIKSLGL